MGAAVVLAVVLVLCMLCGCSVISDMQLRCKGTDVECSLVIQRKGESI